MSATNKWTFPECSNTSFFNLDDMSSLSISAASNSPSAVQCLAAYLGVHKASRAAPNPMSFLTLSK